MPPNATAGDLTVTTGGNIVGPLRFRTTSFIPGLGPFDASYEQPEGARPMPGLSTPRSDHAGVVIGDSVYVIGGSSHGEYIW